jgi:hypothetical protein
LVLTAFVLLVALAMAQTMKDKYPLLVRVDRSQAKGNQTLISGMMLDTRTKEKRDVQWFCDSPIVVSKEAALFPARQVNERNYKLVFRRMGSDKLVEADCKE